MSTLLKRKIFAQELARLTDKLVKSEYLDWQNNIAQICALHELALHEREEDITAVLTMYKFMLGNADEEDETIVEALRNQYRTLLINECVHGSVSNDIDIMKMFRIVSREVSAGRLSVEDDCFRETMRAARNVDLLSFVSGKS